VCFVAGGRAKHGLPRLSGWAAAPVRRPLCLQCTLAKRARRSTSGRQVRARSSTGASDLMPKGGTRIPRQADHDSVRLWLRHRAFGAERTRRWTQPSACTPFGVSVPVVAPGGATPRSQAAPPAERPAHRAVPLRQPVSRRAA